MTIDDKTLEAMGVVAGRCASTTKAGTPCKLLPLAGEPFCLFHSRSKRAAELRRKRRPIACTRKELLMKLSQSFQELPSLHIKPVERIRLETQLAHKIHDLLNDLEKISDLEKLVKKNAVQRD